MAAVIQELLGDPVQRVHLGRAARETFEQCFTRSVLLPRYAEVLAPLS
jgi:hypothetical protein